MKIYRFGKIEELKRPVSGGFASSVCDEADGMRAVLRDHPLEKIIRVLVRCGQLWGDKEGRYYKEALPYLVEATGWSKEMAALSLEMLPGILQRESIEQRLRTELNYPLLLDGWGMRNDFHNKIRLLPQGVVLHVSAGNIFLGAVDSLVMGLLTKNINIVKLSSADPLFMLMFAESLLAADDEGVVSRAFAFLNWKGGDKDVEGVFKKRCNAVIVWGGEEAVRTYREGLSIGTKLIEHGPKVSAAVISARAFGECDLNDIATRVSKDVSLWDQSACASPQVLYIEASSDSGRFKSFISSLQKAFDAEEAVLPRGYLDEDEEAEQTHVFLKERARELLNKCKVYPPFRKSKWFITVKLTPGFATSPLNRFLYIRPVEDMNQVETELNAVGGYLQGLGLEAMPGEYDDLASRFAVVGATRLSRIGRMLFAGTGAPHDGGYSMNELVKWVGREDRGDGNPVYLARFAAERAPFYKSRFSKVKDWSRVQLSDLPLMSGEDLFKKGPPKRKDMFTGPMEDGYIFASGGSTGRPKYSFFSSHEFREIATLLTNSLYRAGLSPTDRVANLFVAGHLWSSFIVIDKVLECIGAVNYPLSGTMPIKDAAKFIKEFGINCVMGIPSTITSLAMESQGRLCVEKIFYAGEHAYQGSKELWQKMLNASIIRSAGYASVDAGLIGYQCPSQGGSIHHLLTTHQHMEIIEPETGTFAKTGQAGEIVVTPLNRLVMPLIRYRTGDLGAWLDGRCVCGSSDPFFELKGRMDDRIHIGGARVFTFDISRALKPFSSWLNSNFQVVLEKDGGREKMLIRLESVDDGIGGVDIGKIKEDIYRCCGDLKDSVDMDWLPDIAVSIVPAGSIERVERTQKIRRVVDLR